MQAHISRGSAWQRHEVVFVFTLYDAADVPGQPNLKRALRDTLMWFQSHKRFSDWLHLESVCSQRVVSPSPVKMKTHMEALVCDNKFGTDVEELLFNIKDKTLIHCRSIEFVFMKNTFRILYKQYTKNKPVCCPAPITGLTWDQSYVHVGKHKAQKVRVTPSVFYRFYRPMQGCRGTAGADPSCPGREAGYALEKAPIHFQGHRQTTIHTHTSNLDEPIHLYSNVHVLDCGRKPDPQREPTLSQGRTCNLNTDTPPTPQGIRPKSLAPLST